MSSNEKEFKPLTEAEMEQLRKELFTSAFGTKGKEDIGEIEWDDLGSYRMVGGVKVYQIEEETEESKEMNLIINRVRLQGGLKECLRRNNL